MNYSVDTLIIGMPAYNESQHIAEALDSILNQSYKDFKLIVLDDNSNDETVNILSSYAQLDSRILVIRNHENMGNLYCFLELLKISKSTYFGWLGAHDILGKDYLQVLVETLEKNKYIDYAFGSLIFIDEESNFTGRAKNELGIRHSPDQPWKNYINSIGESRKGGLNFHGIYRLKILDNFAAQQTKTHVGWDHIIVSRALFFGAEFVSTAQYKMRVFKNRKTTTYTRIIPSNSPLQRIKPTYIPLLKGFLVDWWSLPIALFTRIIFLPTLIWKIRNSYDFKLVRNLVNYHRFIIINLFQGKKLPKKQN